MAAVSLFQITLSPNRHTDRHTHTHTDTHLSIVIIIIYFRSTTGKQTVAMGFEEYVCVVTCVFVVYVERSSRSQSLNWDNIF